MITISPSLLILATTIIPLALTALPQDPTRLASQEQKNTTALEQKTCWRHGTGISTLGYPRFSECSLAIAKLPSSSIPGMLYFPSYELPYTTQCVFARQIFRIGNIRNAKPSNSQGTFHLHGSLDSFSLPVFESSSSCLVSIGLVDAVVTERGTWDEVREEAADLLSTCARLVPWQYFVGGATTAGHSGKIIVKLEYETARGGGGNGTRVGELKVRGGL